MIYIDSNSKQTKFIRVRDNASSLVLTNQTTKVAITIDNVINNSKYYIVDFSDYTGYLQNGQYDYVFHSDNQEVLCTGVLQFGDFNTSKAQYETSFEYVQYDPNEPIIEIPEAVIDITKNGTYDVKDYDKANVNVKDEESIVIIGQLEEQITELEDEIEDLEGTVTSYEKEIERLDILKDELQGQIDSVTSINITQNGTYTAPEGILGYNEINVETKKWLAPVGTKFSNSDWDEIPDIDYSNLTPAYLFSSTYNLKYFYCPATLNLIPEHNFNYMFGYSGVKEITGLITDNATDVSYMFYNCRSLTTINGELDFSNCKNRSSMLSAFGVSYIKLYELHTVCFKGSINADISFYCPVLSYDSVKSILTACSNTINNNSKTLTFDSLTLADNNSELSNLITTCNSKGWTISGLTLT